MRIYKAPLLMACSLFCIAVATTSALAQDAVPAGETDNAGLDEIVVTANKRQESANDVPMSITALSGEMLENAGISGVRDLGKLTPGFTFTKTHDNVPVLSIRGVGYYDNFVGATPTVSAYSNEVPMPFPILTGGALLDLERVEVLKGPQGTLFGQNSTGGAINFVAARPKDSFEGLVSLGYGRFNSIEAYGYLTGPISSTINARIAARWENGDPWQRSYTRNDKLGIVNKGTARLLVDFDNHEDFTAEFAVESWYDKSDSQANQLRGLQPQAPFAIHPDLGTFTGTGVSQIYPNAPLNARSADWTPGIDYRFDNEYYRASLRTNYEVNDDLTLTSITALQKMDYKSRNDADGTALIVSDYPSRADLRAFYQELRLAGQTDSMKWVVGGNYANNRVSWSGIANFPDWSIGQLGLTDIVLFTNQTDKTYAAFASMEVKVSDIITLIGGARYTSSRLRMRGCPADSGNGAAAGVLTYLYSDPDTGSPTHIFNPGECYSLNDLDFDIANGAANLPHGVADIPLREENISWRAGVNFEPRPNVLVYANVSRGYKSGAYTLATFNLFSQALPATQETLLAYEVGLKYDSHNFQFTAAGFYYDYKDKQILAPFDYGPPFGILDKQQNIPNARVIGAEGQISWIPLAGLRLGLNATYLDSKVTTDVLAADPFGESDVQINLKGLQFPYSAKWQGSASASYHFAVSSGLDMKLDASLSYRDKMNGRFGGGTLYQLNEYALLDLRAAIETVDGKYSFEIYGRNVTDKYYRVNVTSNLDTVVASAGMPATYGAKATVRF